MDFEEFATKQLAGLVRYAALLAGDRELAQDVVQDALIRANARWRRIRAMDRPDLYVKRMVTTEYLSWRRRGARRAAALNLWGGTLVPPPVADHAEGTAQRWTLNQQLDRLPAKQRAVLVLDYYDGLPDLEIAELLGCSAGSVRVYRARALAALRSVLAAPHPAEEGR